MELFVRGHMVLRANRAVKKLHREVVRYVNAGGQALIYDALLGEGVPEEVTLTDVERDILHRGKNAAPHTTRRGPSHAAYGKATGLEALIGYLWMSGQDKRADAILAFGMELIDRGDAENTAE